jgi:hypothetical protein
MRQRLGKLGIAFLAVALALALTGAGFAHWQETLHVEGTVETGELDWEFLNPPFSAGENPHPPALTCDDVGTDPDYDKDVASTVGVFSDSDADGDYDLLTLTIDHAYPCYHNHCAFWVHCNGSVPLIVERVNFLVDDTVVESLTAPGWVELDLGGTADADISMYWGDNFGVGGQMHFCDYRDMSFSLHILQEAPQGETLTFSIQLVGVQWNEYSP